MSYGEHKITGEQIERLIKVLERFFSDELIAKVCILKKLKGGTNGK